MNIMIAALSATTHMTGVSRHVVNVVRCLLTRTDVSGIQMITGPWQAKAFRDAVGTADLRLHIHSVPIGHGRVKRNFWYYTSLPGLATELKVDVVHLSNQNPLRRGAFHCPTVVSLHDLYPYDIQGNFGYGKVLFNQLMLKECLWAVDAIACVSESTRKQLALWQSQAIVDKAVTIYNCVERPVPPSLHGPLPNWNGNPFFLCVAAHRSNKNTLLSFKVFKNMLSRGYIDSSTQMIIVGIEGPETPRIRRFIESNGLTEKVVFLQGISDAELQWCYKNCEVALAPSFVEGFGYPVTEALLAGCRIVCSDIPAFREVGGDHCQYFSLGLDAEANFAEAIRTAITSPPHPPMTLPQFSLPAIAEQYMNLYRRLIAKSYKRY